MKMMGNQVESNRRKGTVVRPGAIKQAPQGVPDEILEEILRAAGLEELD